MKSPGEGAGLFLFVCLYFISGVKRGGTCPKRLKLSKIGVPGSRTTTQKQIQGSFDSLRSLRMTWDGVVHPTHAAIRLRHEWGTRPVLREDFGR